MGIKIITQTNEQECGVCALTALHNHYFDKPISKELALELSHIDDTGMTIFDFEALGQSLRLECESYEVTFSEFNNLKINNYFVLLVTTCMSNNHYVIARKRKKFIEIYDSCSMEMKKLSYKEIEKIFLNVIILVKKKPNKAFSKTFGKSSTLLMFDLKFVLLNVGLSVLILTTSVVCATFLNYVIDLAISKSSINNLITICFIFILFYFMNDILTYVSNLYMAKHVKNYFVLFTNKILSSMETKNNDFLYKVDKNWIFKVDECVYNISNFCIVEINKFITNIIFITICICIIGSIQYYLLIFVLIWGIIEFIFFLFSYRQKKDVFLNIVRNENNNAKHYKDLIYSLNNELWFSKRQSLITKIKNNYSGIYKNYSDVILFRNNANLGKSLLKSFCEICLIALMSYFVIKTEQLSIGKLVFGISAFALFKNSTSDLFGYFLAKIEFNIYWQVYKDLTTVGNVYSKQTVTLKEKIKTISFEFKNKWIKFDIKEKLHIVDIPILDLIKKSKKININNLQKEIDKNIMDKLIIVDEHSTPTKELVIKDMSSKAASYSQYLRFFNIDLNKGKQSFYDSIIINLLSLLSEKDKIIFVDNIHHYIKKKDKVVVKQLLNKIRRNNALFIVGKEDND